MKKVLITIRGTHGLSETNDTVEFMTRGVMRKTADDDLVLSYDDDRILGDTSGKSVKTRLTIEKNDRVTIERGGELSSRIVIEKGVRNDCLYSVSNMDLTLGIFGKTVQNDLTENGGRISMTYEIDANSRPLSQNIIEITVKEV